MSDLADLFPDLPPEILGDFDQASRSYQADAPLQVGGEQAQVTDEQIAAYLQSVGSLRAPLPPAVSGQQTPPVPEFRAGQGRQAPDPGASYVEAPDLGNAPSSPVQPPQATEATPLPVSPLPSSDFQAPPPPPLTAGTDADAETTPSPPPAPTRTEGIEALAQLWDDDPALRNLVAGYLTTGRVPADAPSPGAPPYPPSPPGGAGSPSTYPPPQAPPTYPPPVQPSPPYPPAAEGYADEFADPTLRALYEQNTALQARLDRLENAQQYSADQYNRAQLNHYEQIIESTVSKFATDYQLPPNVTKAVRETAARIGAANTYMNGTHPITGLPVRPDPHEAVKTALSIAYYATPQAQELERNRTIARASADAARKQKLSGVGGSSASVPRQAPQPTTPAERRTAMENEMREMFNGSWTGGNN